MEVFLEDQVLSVDSMEEVTSDANPFKKLLKKEQRLIARLQEEQEAEARAQDRFQRAQTRLERRRKGLERIQGKLVHVREQLAELHITDQHPDISSETNTDRKPTKPLRFEQPDTTVAESHSSEVQSAKEEWIAAETAMQNVRNAAQGMAASISYLSQTDGFSNEFMEELVRKQADANRELLKAQDAARAAYERFVQAQRDSESAANRLVDVSTNNSEDSSQQKQEYISLPPAEENGVDQTAKLHAIRLYSAYIENGNL
jgi:hypothetical protein